jgi:hypothetical protein
MQHTIKPTMHHYPFETILLIIASFFTFSLSLFNHEVKFNDATMYIITIMVLTSLIKGVSVFIGGAITRYFWNKIFKK